MGRAAPAGEAVQEGLVVSRQSGFYDVWLADGRIVPCRLRGSVRKRGPVLTGDRVCIRALSDGQGVIEAVQPRSTELARPPLANVNCLVAVAAAPEPDWMLLDRLLVVGESSGLRSIVCFHKVDLVEAAVSEGWAATYERVGYPVVCTSVRTGEGLDRLARFVADQVATLSGPSGAGKSSLVNALCPGVHREVGGLARRIDRGRQTTRVARLLPMPFGGLVADTAGFSRLDLDGIDPRRLDSLMPDIARHARDCQFGESCLHQDEPGCAVRSALDVGAVDERRYRHYRRLLDEALEMEARRYS